MLIIVAICSNSGDIVQLYRDIYRYDIAH